MIRNVSARISAFILASGFVFSGAVAEAAGGSGVLFDVNLFYTSTKAETTASAGATPAVNNDSTTAIYDIKLGYLATSGLYLGGIYTSRSDSALNQSSSSGSAMGASIGYMGGAGIFIQAHYLTTATLGTYSEGSGYQVDVGYKAGMGSGWLLGAELTYRTIDYKKNSTSASMTSYKVAEVLPMISIGYLF